MPPSRQRRLLWLWASVTAALAIRAFATGILRPGTSMLPPAGTHVRIDVNRASVGELMALPGIGRVRAEAIVLHRVRRGPLADLCELTAVDGIGDETVRELAPHAFAGR